MLLTQHKIKTIQEMADLSFFLKEQGQKIIQCHGVFDLVHPGHIRHFKEAKELGDKLVVSITPDNYVNKGPGRPAFNQEIRLETLASLEMIDYVVLNDSPDAISIITRIQPDIYVKGKEYKDHDADITGKILEEQNAVESVGGTIFYTDDIVFSSSSLLNKYFTPFSPEQKKFLENFKKKYSTDQIFSWIESLSHMRVLVIGDAIIDEYQYVEPLGQSGKGLHMTARNREKEAFLGGSFAVARHLSSFVKGVSLLTSIGEDCPFKSLMEEKLENNISRVFVENAAFPTLTKRRYIFRDGNTLTKLFETYSSNDPLLTKDQESYIIDFIVKNADEYDLVIACDFGNGFTNRRIIEAISRVKSFLAVNTQTNSGNRGFNVVTNYDRADFISLNEPELRLATHDRYSKLENISQEIALELNCKNVCVTQGVKGVQCFNNREAFHIPAFADSVVDRVGAGDSFLAIASACAAKGYPLDFCAFIGSLAAALDVQIVGNKEPIDKVSLNKFITRLFK